MSTLKHSTLSTFTTKTGQKGQFYSLPKLAESGFPNLHRLPVSIRIVLESVLRNCDGKKFQKNIFNSWPIGNLKPNELMKFLLSWRA